MLTKLLFRTLPDQYTPGSAYAHFPFLDPVYMKSVMADRDAKEKTRMGGKYVWERPGKAVETRPVKEYQEAQEVMAATGRLFVDGSAERLGKVLGHGVPDLEFVSNAVEFSLSLSPSADHDVGPKTLNYQQGQMGEPLRQLD